VKIIWQGLYQRSKVGVIKEAMSGIPLRQVTNERRGTQAFAFDRQFERLCEQLGAAVDGGRREPDFPGVGDVPIDGLGGDVDRTPGSEYHMLASFAEFERSLIRERQREGIALAKKAGVYRGRKPSLLYSKMPVTYGEHGDKKLWLEGKILDQFRFHQFSGSKPRPVLLEFDSRRLPELFEWFDAPSDLVEHWPRNSPSARAGRPARLKSSVLGKL
jgi:Resolvase, N terminal domain